MVRENLLDIFSITKLLPYPLLTGILRAKNNSLVKHAGHETNLNEFVAGICASIEQLLPARLVFRAGVAQLYNGPSTAQHSTPSGFDRCNCSAPDYIGASNSVPFSVTEVYKSGR